jgi:hypothetical protein
VSDVTANTILILIGFFLVFTIVVSIIESVFDAKRHELFIEFLYSKKDFHDEFTEPYVNPFLRGCFSAAKVGRKALLVIAVIVFFFIAF